MPSFLLELFSEEIPARMQKAAILHLQESLLNKIQQAGLTHGEVSVFVTPRRLAIRVLDIPEVQPDLAITKKGPKTNAPQAAIDGFLKSSGLTIDKLEKRLVENVETYFAVIQQEEKLTEALLKTTVIMVLAEFLWSKSMRWGSGETRWVRPLHSILCLFDGKVVPVEFAGVKAGNVTYGHRFLAPQAIVIADPAEYEEKLKAAYVMADRAARMLVIAEQAEASATKAGLAVKQDQGLLEEVTGLVEWPNVLVGRIDAKYMDLPPEVLVSEMRSHQKYFALQQKDGAMADQFLITSNMIANDDGKAIIAGNERVLRARLADGRFFWDQDRKKPLSDWADGLKGVTFHAKLGSIADKVIRVQALAAQLAPYANADAGQVQRASQLCKADLVTGMVGEFPELQGIMGRYYALQQSEPQAVADAIRDHYLPLGPDSSVPTNPVSACVALADKFDTLISMFAVGEKPTGSKDPFALRRSALGIIRIILENQIRLPLKSILTEELIAFFCDRLKVMLKDSGIRHDVISAVLAGGDDDFVRVVQRAKALQAFLVTVEGASLLAAYKRASNIFAKEEAKDGVTYHQSVEPEHLHEDAEKQFYTLLEAEDRAIKLLLKNENYSSAMASLAKFKTPLDAFFEQTLINCEDVAVRVNRLRLLSQFVDYVKDVADFSQIES